MTKSNQDGLTFAPELVPEMIEDLGMSQEAEQVAIECAQTFTFEKKGIQHAPTTIAAASVYRAGILVNEKVTQAEVAEAAGVSEATVKNGFGTIKERDDVQWTETSEKPARRRQENGRIERVRQVIGL